MSHRHGRSAPDPALPSLRGNAAVFHVEGDPTTEYWLGEDVVEHILPGAFDDALADADDVAALFNHEPDLVLGRVSSGTLTLSVDSTGLAYAIDTPDTSVGRSLVEMVGRHDIDGSSFAFYPTDVDWRELSDGVTVREVLSVELLDVGPVTYPAYSGTSAELGATVRTRSGRRAERPYRYDPGRLPEVASRGRTLARVLALDLELFARREATLAAREWSIRRMRSGPDRDRAIARLARDTRRLDRSVRVMRRARRQLAAC